MFFRKDLKILLSGHLRDCPDHVLILFLLPRSQMKRRKKQCPPLPAQRRTLNEHTSTHTGPNLYSLMSSHQWTDTPVKFLVVFFSCLSVKSSFIQTEHVLLDS